MITQASEFNWKCKHTWKKSANNTKWCLIGCAIGDFGTILYFQYTGIPWLTIWIMTLAIINGLITSIILETVILIRQNINFQMAIKTALGMSFLSMLTMEVTMNIVDWGLTGGAKLTWWVIPIMICSGFLSAWPYNYWRLKKYNLSCH
ncbi:MAG: hypothetical protein CML98_00715 [Rhodobiaceae bacterium]|nr:hypothetical protein [Rhodobiaceae bacterium]|tara:strand:- start:7573 stop:8016 length:444 start_codon:yes stop_codon:yes gene_type:complete